MAAIAAMLEAVKAWEQYVVLVPEKAARERAVLGLPK
jgi:hypothetical protein